MNDNLTLQLFAFDCNAIPEDQRANAVKAIKKFGKALRATGRQQNVSGVRFTREEELRVKNTPLQKFKVNDLLESDGSGACPMLDQTSNLIHEVGMRLASEQEHERPSQILMTIIVFGRDNASVRCTYDQLRDIIAHQRDVYKWKFFLLTDFTINMEKLGIAEDDTIIIRKSEADWFARPFDELTDKIVECMKKMMPEKSEKSE
ncbi:MAG: hypothetical protein IK093_01900 [Ruminiclostridium sp.]|nr:hypothetical protein [Ruminiclostridium sp.]